MMTLKHVALLIGLLGLTACAAQPSATQTGVMSSSYDNETQDFGLPPTNSIRTGDYEAPTPTQIQGAQTVSTASLRDMLHSTNPPLLIDVLGGNQTVSLPGAVWARGAGLGVSTSDGVQQRLNPVLADLTRGDKTKPIAFFCLSKTCWLSHNTAVRAVALGYTNVIWYRGGRNAWIAAGGAMVPVHAIAF